MQRKYTVKTNGLIGTCEYTASDPDDRCRRDGTGVLAA
jgi:hypothetical protein